MRVRWTTDAADDLHRIHGYIAEHDPKAAQRVAGEIVEAVALLHHFPQRGRPGRVPDTRELVFTTLPFIAVYQASSDVIILRILHAAQLWPPKPGS